MGDVALNTRGLFDREGGRLNFKLSFPSLLSFSVPYFLPFYRPVYFPTPSLFLVSKIRTGYSGLMRLYHQNYFLKS